ncbi:MAG: hypothetical protein KF864_03720 [Phycisphaeraceae bacterium]|nr:hypothetical protein [Phycisphaeraceae bacterium]
MLTHTRFALRAPSPAGGNSGGDEGFWDKASHASIEKREKTARGSAPPKPPAKGRLKKFLLLGGGAGFVLVVALVAAAPSIAGALAPGLVASRSGSYISGRATLQSASFAWGGPQHLRGLKIIDTADREVASIRAVKVDAGLVGLIRGSLDLGVITLTGLRADVVREPDGTTNLQRLAPPAPASAPPKSSAPAPGLPTNLRASLVVEGASASFTDRSAAAPGAAPLTVEIDEVDVNAAIAVGRPITLQASARARDAAQPLRAGGRVGSITINATIDDLFAKDGGFTPDLIDADIKAEIKTFPLALVDAFLGTLLRGGSLREGLGDTADLNITATGGLAKGAAVISAQTANASLRAPLSIANNVITAASPLEFTLKGSAGPALSPAVRTMMAGGDSGATITQLPDIAARVEQLSMPLPRAGAPLDLRKGSAVIALSLGETAGGVTLQQGAAPSPFRVAPVTVRLDAPDLAAPARLTAQTTATLSGQAAGNLDVDLTIGGLLTPAGAPSARPGSVRGRIALSGVATAIAQPFLQGTGINLQQQVGPSLDASITLAGELADAARIPPTDLDVRVESEHLKIDGELRITEQGITTRPRGLSVESARFPSIVGRLVKPEVGYAVWPSKPVVKGLSLVVRNLDAAWEGETFGIDLTRVSADADISLEGMAIRPIIGPNEYAPALDITQLTVRAVMAKGGGIDADIDSTMWHEAKPFTIKGRVGATDLLARHDGGGVGLSMATMKPSGRLELTNVPVGIVKMAPPTPPAPPTTPTTPTTPAAEGAPVPLDLPALLAGVIGPRVSAVLSAQTQAANAYDIDLRLTADRLVATTTLRGTPTALDIRAFEANATITPESVTSLVNAFAPTVEGLPRLASPGRLTAKIDPVSIPLAADGKPDLSRAGPASLAINAPARILITGLTMKNADGSARDLGEVGIENFQITARAPLSALAGPTLPAQRAATLSAKGSLLAAGGLLALLDSTISADLSDKALAGPLTASINMTQVNVDALERLAGQPGKLSGAVGTPAGARIDTTLTPPPGHTPGAPIDVQQSTIGVRATLDAPRLKTDGPLAATLTPDSIRLDQPSRMTFTVDPAWANTFLAPAPSAGTPPTPSASVRDIAPIAIAIERFTWPREGASVHPSAAATITLPSLTLAAPDGTPMRLNGASFSLNSAQPTPAATTLNFRIDVAEAAVAQQPPVRGMNVRGEIGGLITPAGTFNPAGAHLTARGDLPQIPTVLLDVFAKSDGMIPDALGDVARAEFDIERYPLGDAPPAPGAPEPRIQASATSPRATASLRGNVREGVFVGQEPLRASLLEVTQALSRRLIKGLPMIGTLEKTPQDQAATLVASGLTVPLSNDMSKLNGDFVIDPGEARFDTGSVFSEVLKFVKQKETGLVGQRLEPLTVRVRSGVATYERWSVPMGQFNIASEGTVNLVERTIDVVTYVPFGALSDRALGQLNLGAGSAISRILPGAIEALTEVPFRTKGPLDKPSTGVDAEMFARNLTRSISPERVIRDNLGDLIKRNLPPPK